MEARVASIIITRKLFMALKSKITQVPQLVNIYHHLIGFGGSKKEPLNPRNELLSLSNDKLLALMRHEAHRIEKAVYNNILKSKNEIYQDKRHRVGAILQILSDRGFSDVEPTILWARQIYDAFENLEVDFIQRNSSSPLKFDESKLKSFIQFLSSRRSVRVWAEEQPSLEALEEIAYSMVDAARWAPTSGNRQPWRFRILKKLDEKELLRKIKEEHCISAPLLIFIGMDTRLYGALGNEERSIYIDAGAAIMQMVLLAHECGLGVCWNHFADDIINSRDSNKAIYKNFTNALCINDYIAPIAILAIGVPKFIPPEPSRMEVNSLMLG